MYFSDIVPAQRSNYNFLRWSLGKYTQIPAGNYKDDASAIRSAQAVMQALAASFGADDEDDHMHVLRADGTFIETVWSDPNHTESQDAPLLG